MITEQDEKIIAKIKKLLNIANNDSSSDGDIQASMNAVHNLMNRHHLTEEDLAHEPADDYKKTDDAAKGMYRSWLGGKMYTWESTLAVFVSKFVGVPCYADAEKNPAQENGILKRDRFTGKTWQGKSIVFYGVSEDAQIAKELYDDLRLLICTAKDWLTQKMGADFKLRKGQRTFGASGDFKAWSQGVKDGKNTEVSVTRNKKLC